MGLNVNKLPTVPCGANSYLLLDEDSREAAIVDASADVAALSRMVEQTGANVKYILLTHGHFDHMLTLGELRRELSAKVMIHKADAEHLTDSQKSLFSQFLGQHTVFLPADIMLDGGDVIKLASHEISVLHTPGHTRGSVCYTIDDIMFTGDTLFAGSIGRSDLYGGDQAVLNESLCHLASLPHDYTLYAGRGPSSKLFVERDSNPFLRF